ncbi:MAG: restriction endonuclease subunit S [candidate division WOR-3 bacterium]|nr:restriction endonuclease subunit S [candidate division WOR-3 bacterium]
MLTQSAEMVDILPDLGYQEVTVRLWGRGVVLRRRAEGAEMAAQRRSVVHTGQLLLSRIDARNGAIGLVPADLDGAVVSNDFPSFNLNPAKLLPAYVGWLSRTGDFVDRCKAASEGTTNRVRLDVDRFLKLTTPLPPLPEQRRIVARIEELAGKHDEARRHGRDAVEVRESLLPSAYSAAFDAAASISPSLERLGDLCRLITDGTHVTPRYVPEGVAFLSVKDITTGIIRFDDAKKISTEEQAALTRRCRPERDDVLLTKVGTTGFAKAIDVDREFSIFVSLALLKLDLNRLLPRYTEYMLNSSRVRDLSARDTRGVGNKNLVLKFIREFRIPAPPLADQRRIVAELDALQAKVDELKRLQAETQAELDALLPSILDRAFKGEL